MAPFVPIVNPPLQYYDESFEYDYRWIKLVFRYTYGKQVKGKLEMKIQIVGSDYYKDTNGAIVTKSGEVMVMIW